MNNNTNEMAMPINGLFSNRFVVPLYQRNFAWRTDEIQQFLQDIWDAFKKYEEKKRDYYIGSLVVMRRHDGSLEVIDGQQRLTVISLIAILMGRLTRPILFFDSRPEVQKFFEILWRDSGKLDATCALTEPSLFYLKEACEFIMNASVEQPVKDNDGNTSYTQVTFLNEKKAGVADFFMDHVVLVCNVVPEDTDVAAYFEIMNNRGEQLQKHEIVKAQMMTDIPNKKQRDEFATIWDACSQMDVPVQRLFSSEDRKKYFGDQYDKFCLCFEEGNEQNDGSETQTDSLYNILVSNQEYQTPFEEQKKTGTTETDVFSYRSIIDFPNFLMHVLKLYLSIKGNEECDVPLNEKDLINVYRKNEEDIAPIGFVKHLLFCRTVFDRFVVKTITDADDSDDGPKWVMLKPTKKDEKWYFSHSISFDNVVEKKLVKALSMLQVTFRTRVYKAWLYDALYWLYKKCWTNAADTSKNATFSFDFDVRDYLMFLHGWMCKYYKDNLNKIEALKNVIPDEEMPSQDNSYSPGTSVPHFLLNFIDYLYCCKYPDKYLFDQKSTFEYKYWNSVEHHLAQNKAKEESKQYVDNLGNLYLINQNANSRLSDRVVQEKVDFYADKNMGPNRQIIYAMTKDKNKWDGEQIAKHYNDIVRLLAARQDILGLSPSN